MTWLGHRCSPVDTSILMAVFDIVRSGLQARLDALPRSSPVWPFGQNPANPDATRHGAMSLDLSYHGPTPLNAAGRALVQTQLSR